ncbi:hypothetical protein CNR22_17870 [Sphingobacteriaceae bacterium]|nr:hypothetical protein CNR22_17870 [Sphingobacteriaceae bacterium]
MLFLIFSFLSALHLFAQTEFKTYDKGLIYSSETMGKLEHIVDSLNLKYKVCDANKVFFSKSQTLAYVVVMESGNVKRAKEAMKDNVTFEKFKSEFPESIIRINVLVLKTTYNRKNKSVVEYSEVDFKTGRGMEIEVSTKDNPSAKDVKNHWIFEYSKRTEYSEESLRAFYFPGNFKSEPLKMEYSRMIGYADCLIDTNTTKLLKDASEGYVLLPEKWKTMNQAEKEKLLKDMRSTYVMGQCSMDSRPREHAMNIALLSAETTNWEVFLRSHLDIMNDRFDRRSDGSYAYARRKTYIKELEELNIDVAHLLLGISLRVENPASNHYYGTIWRLGRAISESQQRKQFEDKMLQLLEDNELDVYNRALVFFLYKNYLVFLEDKSENKLSKQRLEVSVKKLPPFMREHMTVED